MKPLEEKLKEAQENKERALSRAQLTKSGHVSHLQNSALVLEHNV